jgi:small subunit ribosomal protein S10e
MLISSQNRKKIYQHLFQEGVLVAKKDFNAPKHMELALPNLEVIKAMQSLTSKGYVVTKFSWQVYYYYLTNEGIDFLRGVLGLPMEVVPRTLIKTKSEARRRSLCERSERNMRAQRALPVASEARLIQMRAKRAN